ncbi:MAG: (d)CMP kinase [Thermodesulfovibrionales bacterium]|nr:(d)CMP kinase [Thermodesulfovibrionales bacterium]
MKKVIAIDGPSGAGKSTVSKMLANKLGFQYLDTGALYRTVALYLKENGLNEKSSDEEIYSALNHIIISISNGKINIVDQKGFPLPYLIDGISEKIRTTEIGHYASFFSSKKVVRDFLLNVQRESALLNNIVAEGRDMTTVVFPNAWLKLYLDATENERATRRYKQLRSLGINVTMAEAIQDVRDRDLRDSKREIAPLKKAEDAIYIDTTERNPEDIIEQIMKIIDNKEKSLLPSGEPLKSEV